MLEYEEAVRRWGITRLSAKAVKTLDPDSVEVEFDLNEGVSCCGGSDPLCYCSFAESPSMEAVISYRSLPQTGKRNKASSITLRYIDFVETLREIFAISEKEE